MATLALNMMATLAFNELILFYLEIDGNLAISEGIIADIKNISRKMSTLLLIF